MLAKLPPKAKIYMDTGKHSHTEMITDLNIKLSAKSHRDLLQVKVDGGAESCGLPLTLTASFMYLAQSS